MEGLQCVWVAVGGMASLTATTFRIQVKLCDERIKTSRLRVSPVQIDRTWIFGDLHLQGAHADANGTRPSPSIIEIADHCGVTAAYPPSLR